MNVDTSRCSHGFCMHRFDSHYDGQCRECDGVQAKHDFRALIPITLFVREPMTLGFIAQRVAEACGKYNALKEGEGVLHPTDPRMEFRIDPKAARAEADKLLAEIYGEQKREGEFRDRVRAATDQLVVISHSIVNEKQRAQFFDVVQLLRDAIKESHP